MVDFVMNGLITVNYPGTTPVNISPPPLTVKAGVVEPPEDYGYYDNVIMATEYRAATYSRSGAAGRIEMCGNAPDDKFIARISVGSNGYVEKTERRNGSNNIINDKVKIGDFRGRVIELAWWTECMVASDALTTLDWDDQVTWDTPIKKGTVFITGDMGLIAIERHAGVHPSEFILTYNGNTTYAIHHGDGLYYTNYSSGRIGSVVGNGGVNTTGVTDPIKTEFRNIPDVVSTFYFTEA